MILFMIGLSADDTIAAVDLFQKDHRIPLNAIRRRIDLYMCRQLRLVHL